MYDCKERPGAMLASPSAGSIARSASPAGRRSQAAFNLTLDDAQDDRPAPLDAQLQWLGSAGFINADCYWKWLELAVIAGEHP